MTQLALALDNVRFERQGGLTDRALTLLEAGPASTQELATRVMSIRGGAGAAAAAVFALLGGDARFRVSRDGVWSLAPGAGSLYAPVPAGPATTTPRRRPPAEPREVLPLRSLWEEEWVVVDFETTGGAPGRGHRVTEVGAVSISAGKITGSWSTLVNPGRRIPGMITALTGISEAMVAQAPRFGEVADKLAEVIRGKVFVAHNAAFDWRFMCHEMRLATGMEPRGRQLCTVRLARKLLPELPSRGLDALALYFGIRIESRHRALDDAVATARVLIRFLEMLEERGASDWNELEVVLGRRARRKKRVASPVSMECA